MVLEACSQSLKGPSGQGTAASQDSDYNYEAVMPSRAAFPSSLVIWALETENQQLRRRASQFLLLLVAKEPRIGVDNPEILEEMKFLEDAPGVSYTTTKIGFGMLGDTKAVPYS